MIGLRRGGREQECGGGYWGSCKWGQKGGQATRLRYSEDSDTVTDMKYTVISLGLLYWITPQGKGLQEIVFRQIVLFSKAC